jgi:Ser/Thr protein kinase RdoA (MazF antagonist)
VSAAADETSQIAPVLAAWPGFHAPRIAPLPGGLIHRSFAVSEGAAQYVLQRVSPIFAPGIHENIRAVTEHLAAKSVATPRLLPTRDGELCADLGEGGTWRLMTRDPGLTFEVCRSPEQARSAGTLVARFHSALDDLDYVFRPLGIRLHDTAAHLATLQEALAAQREHPLHAAVARLAEEILRVAQGWESLEGLPLRVGHGDLKFNNVLFAGEVGTARNEAVSLIDLDTVSRVPLWAELGDAWRSWCNRRGEDAPEAELDLELFHASVQGYRSALSIRLDAAERASLAQGLERISLELAARFAADALNESYFAWDPARFHSHGEHNLTRARGQLSLHRQARETRDERRRILGR